MSIQHLVDSHVPHMEQQEFKGQMLTATFF